MPLYYFKCVACDATLKYMMDPDQVKDARCKQCEGKIKRQPRAPSTQVMERLDNGVMKRALERLSNAEELHKERAKSDPRIKKDLS
jgi:DNA-directed RNA polymerase subunit RPC12/RpoP